MRLSSDIFTWHTKLVLIYWIIDLPFKTFFSAKYGFTYGDVGLNKIIV